MLMKTKICPKCSREKSTKEFNKNSGKKDGFQNICRSCQHIYWSSYYKGDAKKKHLDKKYQRRKAIREWVTDFKVKSGCIKCGEKHPACLVFHHKDGDKKEGLISELVGDAYALTTIQKEIKKCVVMCSNCHRKHHWNNGG